MAATVVEATDVLSLPPVVVVETIAAMLVAVTTRTVAVVSATTHPLS